MSVFHIVNSEHTLKMFIQRATADFHKYKWVKWSQGLTKRSLNANALSHVWYAEVSKQLSEDTIDGVKGYCKLTFGVPILRQREKFNNFYETFFVNLSYEKQLAAMKYLSVTSIMEAHEMNIYMENMKMHFEGRGVFLSEPK